ncbi:MAG TPA: cyclopropane-fatty-acyl-phospholipid synthase family protein, partial [Verrucomicrobiae bacterium]|nr:cyclopropane-fatty-acyl-phospholipid synthase family protein [Verrucomicrobiae bacterium]
MARLTFPFSRSVCRWLLQKIYQSIGHPRVRLSLARGEAFPPGGTEILTTVRIADLRTLATLVVTPEIGFGEGYSKGRIEVQGDLVRFLDAVLASIRDANAIGWYSKLVSRWFDLAQRNSVRGSLRNIHHHYDVTADFYKLWLDPQLVYTCAYFPEPFSSLEDAQIAKMDHVCRKIWLQPGERVVEAGCGWGALALHMAGKYGAKVRAFNISKEQILVARERAKQAGLERQVEFIEDDYRNITGHYDAFVSVGMLEHIGTQNYETLGEVVHRTIGDAGRGILHFIGRNFPYSFSPWIRKRIFPGACAPSLAQAMAVLQPWNFSVLDVENLRNHYVRTLELWLDRFESAWDSVVELLGTE